MHLLITRPQPDADRLAQRLEKSGHRCTISPLMKFTCLPPPEFGLENTQAAILTSRNCLRALTGTQCASELHQLPLFTVGSETAKQAKLDGFTHIKAVAESARELAVEITRTSAASDGQLIYLSGSHQAYDMETALTSHGFTVVNIVLYHMRRVDNLSERTLTELEAGRIEGVLLLSQRTARIYTDLIRQNQLTKQVRSIVHFCLSKNIAHALDDLDMLDIRISAKPELSMMLQLIDFN